MNIRNTGIVCIFLGVLLYVAYLVFCGKEISAFGDFQAAYCWGCPSLQTSSASYLLRRRGDPKSPKHKKRRFCIHIL